MKIIKDCYIRILKGRLKSDGDKEIDREFTIIRRVTIDNYNNYFCRLENGDICICTQSPSRLWIAFDVTGNITKAKDFINNQQLSFFES